MGKFSSKSVGFTDQSNCNNSNDLSNQDKQSQESLTPYKLAQSQVDEIVSRANQDSCSLKISPQVIYPASNYTSTVTPTLNFSLKSLEAFQATSKYQCNLDASLSREVSTNLPFEQDSKLLTPDDFDCEINEEFFSIGGLIKLFNDKGVHHTTLKNEELFTQWRVTSNIYNEVNYHFNKYGEENFITTKLKDELLNDDFNLSRILLKGKALEFNPLNSEYRNNPISSSEPLLNYEQELGGLSLDSDYLNQLRKSLKDKRNLESLLAKKNLQARIFRVEPRSVKNGLWNSQRPRTGNLYAVFNLYPIESNSNANTVKINLGVVALTNSTPLNRQLSLAELSNLEVSYPLKQKPFIDLVLQTVTYIVFNGLLSNRKYSKKIADHLNFENFVSKVMGLETMSHRFKSIKDYRCKLTDKRIKTEITPPDFPEELDAVIALLEIYHRKALVQGQKIVESILSRLPTSFFLTEYNGRMDYREFKIYQRLFTVDENKSVGYSYSLNHFFERSRIKGVVCKFLTESHWLFLLDQIDLNQLTKKTIIARVVEQTQSAQLSGINSADGVRAIANHLHKYLSDQQVQELSQAQTTAEAQKIFSQASEEASEAYPHQISNLIFQSLFKIATIIAIEASLNHLPVSEHKTQLCKEYDRLIEQENNQEDLTKFLKQLGELDIIVDSTNLQSSASKIDQVTPMLDKNKGFIVGMKYILARTALGNSIYFSTVSGTTHDAITLTNTVYEISKYVPEEVFKSARFIGDRGYHSLLNLMFITNIGTKGVFACKSNHKAGKGLVASFINLYENLPKEITDKLSTDDNLVFSLQDSDSSNSKDSCEYQQASPEQARQFLKPYLELDPELDHDCIELEEGQDPSLLPQDPEDLEDQADLESQVSQKSQESQACKSANSETINSDTTDLETTDLETVASQKESNFKVETLAYDLSQANLDFTKHKLTRIARAGNFVVGETIMLYGDLANIPRLDKDNPSKRRPRKDKLTGVAPTPVEPQVSSASLNQDLRKIAQKLNDKINDKLNDKFLNNQAQLDSKDRDTYTNKPLEQIFSKYKDKQIFDPLSPEYRQYQDKYLNDKSYELYPLKQERLTYDQMLSVPVKVVICLNLETKQQKIMQASQVVERINLQLEEELVRSTNRKSPYPDQNLDEEYFSKSTRYNRFYKSLGNAYEQKLFKACYKVNSSAQADQVLASLDQDKFIQYLKHCGASCLVTNFIESTPQDISVIYSHRASIEYSFKTLKGNHVKVVGCSSNESFSVKQLNVFLATLHDEHLTQLLRLPSDDPRKQQAQQNLRNYNITLTKARNILSEILVNSTPYNHVVFAKPLTSIQQDLLTLLDSSPEQLLAAVKYSKGMLNRSEYSYGDIKVIANFPPLEEYLEANPQASEQDYYNMIDAVGNSKTSSKRNLHPKPKLNISGE